MGRGKREKLVNGRKIKANGTVRRSRDDKRAEEETMDSFSDSKQFFYQLPSPQKKVRENANEVFFLSNGLWLHINSASFVPGCLNKQCVGFNLEIKENVLTRLGQNILVS